MACSRAWSWVWVPGCAQASLCRSCPTGAKSVIRYMPTTLRVTCRQRRSGHSWISCRKSSWRTPPDQARTAIAQAVAPRPPVPNDRCRLSHAGQWNCLLPRLSRPRAQVTFRKNDEWPGSIGRSRGRELARGLLENLVFFAALEIEALECIDGLAQRELRIVRTQHHMIDPDVANRPYEL